MCVWLSLSISLDPSCFLPRPRSPSTPPKVYKILPVNVMGMIYGLVMCFFGGFFHVTIAAIEVSQPAQWQVYRGSAFGNSIDDSVKRAWGGIGGIDNG